MHEHVGKQLVYLEITCQEKMKAENIVKIQTLTSENPCGSEHQHVDYQQILCYYRYSEHIQNDLSKTINNGKSTKNICYTA